MASPTHSLLPPVLGPPASRPLSLRDMRAGRPRSQGLCCDSLAEGACVRSPERGDGEKGFILSGKRHLGAVNRE
jgi:hypothetical protein